MAFKDYRYEGDDGEFYKCRMDTELFAALAANVEPSGGTAQDIHVYSKVSQRRYGIHARHIIATRAFGTAPDNGVKRIEVPILDPAAIEGDPAAIGPESTFTYKGNTWTVASVEPETTR